MRSVSATGSATKDLDFQNPEDNALLDTPTKTGLNIGKHIPSELSSHLMNPTDIYAKQLSTKIDNN